MHTTKSSWRSEFYHLVFWGYNIVFTFLLLFLISQLIFNGQRFSLHDVLTFWGFFPPHVMAMMYTLFLTPWVSMLFAIPKKIHTDAATIIKLFFGFEIPLMGLSLAGVIFLRQLTLVTGLIYLSFLLSIVGLILYLFHTHIQSKMKIALLMVSQQIALIVAGYAFLLGFFFLPIVVAYFIKMLSTFNYHVFITSFFWSLTHGGLIYFIVYLVFALFMMGTMGLFALGPISAFFTFWKVCATLYKKVVKEYGLKKARIIRYGTSVVFILLLVLLSIQTNVHTYNSLIAKYKNAQTFEEKQTPAEQVIRVKDQIRKNLTSSYLAQYRYLSDSSMNVLIQGYTNELKMNKKSAESIQKLFNTLAVPFIYKGTFEEDIKQAAENYQELFDNSIQKGELETISKTLRATNTQDSMKAGILDLAKQTVHVVSKAVTVNEENDGLLATVTIEEEYENTAKEAQEVYYEFSLPDDAVLTDLKLGPDLQIGANSADKPIPTPQISSAPQSISGPTTTPSVRVDTAVVAAKGAANTVYENQVFRRTDPALLVQVGPRQYKLRVYPIPIKGRTVEGLMPVDGVASKNQKVRYSYVAMRTSQGIPLPSITEQRNVYTDSNTKTTYELDGVIVNPDNSNFIKPKEPAVCSSTILKTATAVGTVLFIPHRVNPSFSGSYNCEKQFANVEKKLNGAQIAILLDTSYSNSQIDWSNYLMKNFPIESLLRDNTVELYYFNDTISQKISLTPSLLHSGLKVINMGQTNRVKALSSIPENYDLVLMVTDDSVFDAKPDIDHFLTKAPLYIIHPEGRIPPYNDVLTNAVIQSHGKVVSSGFEAIDDYWLQHWTSYFSPFGSVLDIDNYGMWLVIQGTIPSFFAHASTQVLGGQSPFAELAHKRLVIDSIRQAGQSVSNTNFLDRINLISQQSNIVTPYSSMIVLVTDAQKQQLAAAMKQNNRYELGLDTGEETLGNPSGRGILEIGAVPEPHEWVLIISACLLLTYLYREKLRRILMRYL